MQKKLPTLNVLTAVTGICLETGIGCGQETFDHLYPGIMTLGCCAMQKDLKKRILEQDNKIADFLKTEGNPPKGEKFQSWVDKAKKFFGKTITVDGPAENVVIPETF